MVGSLTGPGVGLGAMLEDRARKAPVERLAVDVMVGVAGVSVALGMRPPAWVLLAGAAGCFAAFGGWALCERGLRRSPAPAPLVRRVLAGGRGVCAVFGVVAAAALVLGLLGVALGRLIS
jgi:hypothetical protein